MEIRNARRILCLGAPGCQALTVVEGLTGSAPTRSDSSSIAGLSHSWDIQTAYYSASVSIWLDEIANTAEWQDEFMKPEAKQVVDAIGAWVLCFTDDGTQRCILKLEESLKAIQAIADYHMVGSSDAVMLAVSNPVDGKSTAMTEERYAQLEDITIRYSFELVDYAGSGLNDYGEKQGIDRIREALEANEWTSIESDDDDLGSDFDDTSFDYGEAEMTAELFGLKAALVEADDNVLQHDEDDAGEQEAAVDDLPDLLDKLLAVREQSTDLSLPQRKRIAARAVRDVMQPEGA